MENLSDFLETYFEVVTFINECMENEEHKIYTEIFEQKGRGGLWEIAEQWTNDFQSEYGKEVWGKTKDWSDTLEDFLSDKIQEL